MKRLWLATTVLTLAGALAVSAADPVRIDSGLVSGTRSADGAVLIYRGLPYAAAPIGELRWRPPQPVPPWEGVRPCTEFGPACPQPPSSLGRSPDRQSEDCLYLNVWAPARVEQPAPVMVWIHGGGCATGSGALELYHGEQFARHGIVLVTINYRLGPLGWLAHPLLSAESERGVSGNYGMLDQIAALQWVQRNIAAFGGDPDCVTIFGESAGAASVCRLMISPLAQGLFHRAIAQSGGASGYNRPLRGSGGREETMEQVGERIARELGCDSAPDPIAALRATSPEKLIEVAQPAVGLFAKGTKFGWVVDGWAVPDDPQKLWEQGRQHDVPFMTGSNADEATVFMGRLGLRGLGGYLAFTRALGGRHAQELRRLFPASTDAEAVQAITRLVGVASFVAPARSLVRGMELVDAPGYLYHFTRVPPGARFAGLGAFHGCEVPYVFGNLPPAMPKVDDDLSAVMIRTWAQFARTGDPNHDGLPLWPVYSSAADEHMQFGEVVDVRSGLWREACDLLDIIRAEREGRGLPAGDA